MSALAAALTTSSGGYDVEALKRDHPIQDVVAGCGIELRPSGRALVGRCPFHADAGRPNFTVYPATASWYCYRCNLGGDALAFLMRLEGLDFREACARVAGQAPSPARARPSAVLATAATPSEAGRRWERLGLEEQVVLHTALLVYQHRLWREPRALAYLRGRGLPDWTIRACGLGYADGHALEAFLRRHGFGLGIAQQLGLLRRPHPRGARATSGPGLWEFFGGRIVVPELRGGACVWLVGRDLPPPGGHGRARGARPTERPKYLALAGERPVLGRERAAGRRAVLLCEGVFDYLTAVSWGLPAFSPCGTHLPADRLGFLARAEAIYGVFDGDDAGRAAATRFAALFGERWRPVQLPEGCDLSDLGAHPDGRETFLRLLPEPVPAEDDAEHAWRGARHAPGH